MPVPVDLRLHLVIAIFNYQHLVIVALLFLMGIALFGIQRKKAMSKIEKIHGGCYGDAVIAGTRIPVYEVVALTRAGLSPEAILERFGGNLNKEHILDALAYAWQNEEEIKGLLKEMEKEPTL